MQNQTRELKSVNGKWSWFKRTGGFIAFVVVVIVLLELTSVRPSHANLPVIDGTAISQMILQGIQLAKQLAAMVQQVELLKNQIKVMSGHSGIGILGSELNPFGNMTWREVGDMVEGGITSSDGSTVRALKAAHERYRQSNPRLSSALIPKNPRMNVVYSRNYQEAISGMGMGEQSFNAVPGHLRDLQTFKTKIEQTDTLKGAVDLNTAVNVKNAQLSAELLRLNALNLHMLANTQNTQTSGQAAQAEFFSE